jgi:LacI family transcriptional regulator
LSIDGDDRSVVAEVANTCHLARVKTQRITIDDVAKAAGVARVTVSRVLNNEQNVSPETLQKVKRAVEALGYSVNQQARALATGSTRQIMLIHAHSPEREPNSYYDSGLELGALRACSLLAFDLVTRSIDPNSNDRPRLLSMIIERERPFGLIVSPPLSDDVELIKTAQAAGMPIVAISAGAQARALVSAVGIDEYAGGRAIGAYLVSLGHTCIGFLKGPPEHRSAAQRYDGFMDALRDAGIEQLRWVGTGDFTFKSGAEAAEGLRRNGSPVTALACANDDMAAGAMLSLHRAGLQIPSEISVTGFDDTPMSEIIWPPLTTVRQPIRYFAEHAVHILAENHLNVLRNELLPHELIVRESTAPPMQ